MVLGLEAQRKIKCWDAWSKKKTFSSGFSQPLEWFYSVPDFSKQTFGSLKRLISMQCHLSNYWLTHLMCQKSSTDEQSALNINRKKGKKTKQWQSHILAKDVNVTDWMELMIVFLPDKPSRVIIRLFLEFILIQSNSISKNIVQAA